jgi:hypothetical protein
MNLLNFSLNLYNLHSKTEFESHEAQQRREGVSSWIDASCPLKDRFVADTIVAEQKQADAQQQRRTPQVAAKVNQKTPTKYCFEVRSIDRRSLEEEQSGSLVLERRSSCARTWRQIGRGSLAPNFPFDPDEIFQRRSAIPLAQRTILISSMLARDLIPFGVSWTRIFVM